MMSHQVVEAYYVLCKECFLILVAAHCFPGWNYLPGVVAKVEEITKGIYDCVGTDPEVGCLEWIDYFEPVSAVKLVQCIEVGYHQAHFPGTLYQ